MMKKLSVLLMSLVLSLVMVATVAAIPAHAASANPVEVSISYLNGSTWAPLTAKVPTALKTTSVDIPVNVPEGYTATKVMVAEYDGGGRMVGIQSFALETQPTAFELIRAGSETNVYSKDADGALGFITKTTTSQVWLVVNCQPKPAAPSGEKHILTVQYYVDGETSPFQQTGDVFAAGTEYDLEVEPLDGYAPDRDRIKGIMPDADLTEKVIFRPVTPEKYSLKIELYESGAAEPFDVLKYEHIEGESYDHTLPEHAGFVADKASVSGTMPAEDVIVKVIYSATVKEYTVTVRLYCNGDVFKTITAPRSYKTGEKYSIVLDEISGYVPDRAIVTGTMGDKDVVEDVYYSPIAQEHVLFVEYYFDGSDEPFDVVTKTHKAGDTYSVTSPEHEHYVPDRKIVTGTMPDDNCTERVVYTKNTYPLTVKCYYDAVSGDPFKKIERELTFGESYDIELEQLTGYVISVYTDGHVKGVMNATSKEVNVVYKRDDTPHTLTVQFYTSDGGDSVLWMEMSESYKAGEAYIVYVPTRSGYTVDKSTVEGVMGDEDITVIVTYTKNARPGGTQTDDDGAGDYQP